MCVSVQCFTRVQSSPPGASAEGPEDGAAAWSSERDRVALLQCVTECLDQSACAAILHYTRTAHCLPVVGDVDVGNSRITRGLSDVYIKTPGSTANSCKDTMACAI